MHGITDARIVRHGRSRARCFCFIGEPSRFSCKMYSVVLSTGPACLVSSYVRVTRRGFFQKDGAYLILLDTFVTVRTVGRKPCSTSDEKVARIVRGGLIPRTPRFLVTESRMGLKRCDSSFVFIVDAAVPLCFGVRGGDDKGGDGASRGSLLLWAGTRWK